MALQVSIHEGLGTIEPHIWDSLGGSRDPFLSHAFLHALETTECLQPYGWYPYHILVHEEGRLLAATPLYAKSNSYGEFVFDWAWADAYERQGLTYYPKLVSGIPYTPATGARLLIAPDASEPEELTNILIQQTIDFAHQNKLSSVHWLFTYKSENDKLCNHGLMRRLGCQYHWENHGYRDFDEFLSTFSSRKRKNVKRERRRVTEQGISLHVLHGNELNEEIIETFHGFYLNTFERHWGIPTLSLAFFQQIARRLGDRFVLVMAKKNGDWIAGAANFRGIDTLYGRYWGCKESMENLHFEACYYAGIEYCIEQGLKRFEPGAQGEHKIPRGFLPTPTWSAHWIADPEFRRHLQRFCHQEEMAMEQECQALMALSPYREQQEPTP